MGPAAQGRSRSTPGGPCAFPCEEHVLHPRDEAEDTQPRPGTEPSGGISSESQEQLPLTPEGRVRPRVSAPGESQGRPASSEGFENKAGAAQRSHQS